MKFKNRSKINSKLCTNCFDPIFLKFNFSYIIYDDNFLNEYQLKFLNRIRELLCESYNAIMNRDRKHSFEFLDIKKIDIGKKYSQTFFGEI